MDRREHTVGCFAIRARALNEQDQFFQEFQNAVEEQLNRHPHQDRKPYLPGDRDYRILEEWRPSGNRPADRRA
jgi:hypothetical protein